MVFLLLSSFSQYLRICKRMIAREKKIVQASDWGLWGCNQHASFFLSLSLSIWINSLQTNKRTKLQHDSYKKYLTFSFILMRYAFFFYLFCTNFSFLFVGFFITQVFHLIQFIFNICSAFSVFFFEQMSFTILISKYA